MNENAMLTGKPSIDRPWMKFYPDVLRGIQVPACTVEQYLSVRAADPNVIAMHYYGVDITWGTVFRKVDATARALQVLGIKQGDQIPVFLRSVPEFIYLLLAAERIGASLLCRDNTLEENIEAVQKANAKVIFVHDFFSKAEIEAYREQTNVNTYVIVPALESGDRAAMPVYLQHSLDALYPDVPARGSDTMMWADFCNMGQRFRGFVPAPVNIDRPLLRAYTSGSTGPSKQVIHSAHSIIGVLAQMNFYGASDKFRPTWLLTILPPALIAVVVSMMLLPLAGGMLLILDPFVDVYDVDLEMMRYRPNNWPLIPMFVEVIRRSKRLPADYDMSHMLAIGAGCEAFNNKQLRNVEEFLKQHNCNLRFTAGYGSSEAGSNATLPMAPFPVRDGNVGVPMIHSVISIFKPGTQEELTYNTPGEICMTGPGVMLGYDRPEATAKALQVHADGKTWLHTGDIAVMDDDGFLRIVDRKKDMILVSGFNVYPNEIEDVVMQHPGVQEVAAVGVPSGSSGEAVKIFVVKKDASLTDEALITFCRRHLTGYKVPKLVEFRDELPKSNVGKILRRELRDEARGKVDNKV